MRGLQQNTKQSTQSGTTHMGTSSNSDASSSCRLRSPFLGKWFFVMVDAFSKWPEVRIVRNITAKTIIRECKNIFASFGIPKTLVTYNGRTFISEEFQKFLKNYGITHKCTAPYNPAMNGQAERFIQTIKNALKRANAHESNLETKMEEILLQYRSAPLAITKISSAELFLGRKVRTKIDLLFPNEKEDKDNVNEKIIVKELGTGSRVACRNYVGHERWKFGTIQERTGKLHYKIRLDDGRTWKRHLNQIRTIGVKTPKAIEDEDGYYGPLEEILGQPKNVHSPTLPPQPEHKINRAQKATEGKIRRSTRVSRPPVRYRAGLGRCGRRREVNK